MAIRYRAPWPGITVGDKHYPPNAFVPKALGEQMGLTPSFFEDRPHGRLGKEIGAPVPVSQEGAEPGERIMRRLEFWGEDDAGDEVWSTTTVVVPIGATTEELEEAFEEEIQAWLEEYGETQ